MIYRSVSPSCILAALMLAALSGCRSTSPPQGAPLIPNWTTYGEPEVGPGDTVAIGALRGDERNIVVAGAITEICKVKGCWMNVKDENGKELFTKFKDYGFFVPRNAVGRAVIMHGWAEKREVSVADLRHYAEDAHKSAKEIAAITKPQTRITFIADSVMIEGEGLDQPHAE